MMIDDFSRDDPFGVGTHGLAKVSESLRVVLGESTSVGLQDEGLAERDGNEG